MEYLGLSLLAGILTVFSPCVLPVLPVILGGSLAETNNRLRPLVIILALAISVLTFSLLLKASTALLGIDPLVWRIISGTIIFGFGLITLAPELWAEFSANTKFDQTSDKLLRNSIGKKGLAGDVLAGLALGPVFSSCSPTFALIVAVILPQSFGTGLLNLVIYTAALALTLFAVAVAGQKLLHRFNWALNPHGLFKKALGLILILTGLAIITGIDKQIQTALVEANILNATQLETRFLETRD